MGALSGRAIKRLPNGRFAEAHECGCSFEEGQWFPCGRHRALTEQALDSGALGDLDAVLHAAPPDVWHSISAMRDYLLGHGVRVVHAPDVTP